MEYLKQIEKRLNEKLKKFPKNYEHSYNDGILTAISVVKEFGEHNAQKLASWNKTRVAYKVLQENLSKKLVKLPTNKQKVFNTGILTAKSIVKDVYENERGYEL